MRGIFVTLLIMMLVSSGTAQIRNSSQDTLQWFEEKLELDKDGSMSLILSVIPADHYESLTIPFQFENGESFSVENGSYTFWDGSKQSMYPVATISGKKYLPLKRELDFVSSTEATDDTIRISCKVQGYLDWETALQEHYTYSFGATFVNTSDYYINLVQIALVSPVGYSIHEISKTVPSYNPKKSPTPPFVLDTVDERYRVVLSSKELNTGGKAAIEISIKKKKPSKIPLIIGILLAISYLIFYRDVLKKEE